ELHLFVICERVFIRMIPYKIERGATALARLKVYEGT
nr:hypothetical protein [Tanacetum cinerariifolium]